MCVLTPQCAGRWTDFWDEDDRAFNVIMASTWPLLLALAVVALCVVLALVLGCLAAAIPGDFSTQHC